MICDVRRRKEMKNAMLLAILVSVATVALAVKPEPPKEDLRPIIAIPLSGEKTTLRFIVQNRGDKPAVVYGPFENQTRLVVVHPNGEKKELFYWKEMERAPDPLAPGKSLQWDMDITQWVEMKEKGTYTVSFTVNGTSSDQLQFVKD
jgi:hypothetical protein